MNQPRVALFTDSYYEANGVARTASALEAFAAERDRPLLVVHGGPANQLVEAGSVARLELRRWRRTSIVLDHDLRFDLALRRHAARVAHVLRWFRPDLIHFTGPSDVGRLGAHLGRSLGIPMVGSWHTNLHEYASCRLLKRIGWMREHTQMRLRLRVEHHLLSATMRFYRNPRVVLVPNAEWQTLIDWRTQRRTFVMTRGVDTALFTPARRRRSDASVVVGYVGRLSAEKNVRALAAVYEAFAATGVGNVRFTIVGDGVERDWLRTRMPDAEFTGVLRGERLAEAYANMDLFVFPSETETVGNVVLEAMASGVPVVAMARGGQRFIAGAPASALLARNQLELIELATRLVHDGERRREMSAAARAGALQRSWDPVFDIVYDAYDTAIALARGEDRSEDSLVALPEQRSA